MSKKNPLVLLGHADFTQSGQSASCSVQSNKGQNMSSWVGGRVKAHNWGVERDTLHFPLQSSKDKVEISHDTFFFFRLDDVLGLLAIPVSACSCNCCLTESNSSA